MRQKITYEETFNNKKINTNKAKGLGCIENIVKGFDDRLEYMTNNHQQVSVMQFVVSPAKSTPSGQCNKVIGECLRAVKKTKENNEIEFQAGWVKEISKEASKDSESQRFHYHIGAIIASKKCQSAVGIAKQMKKLLNKRAKNEDDKKTVSVHYCKPNTEKYNEQELHPIETASGIKIRQDKPRAVEQIKNNVLHFLSYPAKSGIQKDRLPSGRGYGFTALPEK